MFGKLLFFIIFFSIYECLEKKVRTKQGEYYGLRDGYQKMGSTIFHGIKWLFFPQRKKIEDKKRSSQEKESFLDMAKQDV